MTQPAFTRLSALLAPLPRNEICLILSDYDQAIRSGTIEATPEIGVTFDITYLDARGQEKTENHNEEFVLNTDDCTRWISTQQLASRYLIMTNTGTLGTTEERLSSNLDDLKALAKMRRDAMNAKAKTAPVASKNAPKPSRSHRKQTTPAPKSAGTTVTQKQTTVPAEPPKAAAAAPTPHTTEQAVLPATPTPVVLNAHTKPINAEDSRAI